MLFRSGAKGLVSVISQQDKLRVLSHVEGNFQRTSRMSGASGALFTIELLKQLQQYKEIIETHLIVTKGAEMTLEQETDYTLEQLYAFADEVHDNYNIGAGPASGSYRTMGMIVIPCSMKTLAGIVSGYSDNLVLRAADITLKERRKKISLPENGLSRYGNLSNNRCLCWQEYIMIIWKRNS